MLGTNTPIRRTAFPPLFGLALAIRGGTTSFSPAIGILMQHRLVQPELLDSLPPDASEAVASRRDLQRINWFMGNGRWIGREMSRERHRLVSPPSATSFTLAELGAGDGTMLLKILRSQAREWHGGRIFLVDRQPVVTAETVDGFRRLGWQVDIMADDVFTWLRNAPITDMMVTNLFLHHFEASALAELLRLVGDRTRMFVACEPRRSPFALLGCRMLRLIGCNHVTRHDAAVSVRAGFRGTELGDIFGGQNGQAWKTRETTAGSFSHLFLATR